MLEARSESYSTLFPISAYLCDSCKCRNLAWGCPRQLSMIAQSRSRDAQANPKEEPGAGDLTPPSHQTYFDTWYGRWILVTWEDGKIWRFLNKRAKSL